MIWAILSVLSGLGDAVIFALSKKLKDIDNVILVWVQYAFALPFLLLLLYFNYPAQVSSGIYWLAVFNAILLAIATFLLVKALKMSELSVSLPVLSATPLFLIVISYFTLGEAPTRLGLVGISFIVIGAYIIHLKNEHGLLAPLISLFTVKGSVYIILVAFIWSITANMFKMGINGSNAVYFTALVCFLVTLIMIPLLARNLKAKITQINKKFTMLLSLGIASALMFAASSYAMASAIVPYVISLKRSSLIFSIFIGYFYFNEKNIRNPLIGTLIMLIGGILITLF